MELYILPAILLFMIGGGLHHAFIYEPRTFNKGICTACGDKLRHFDTDSQGGRLWKCDTCGRWFGISWFADRGHINPRITSADYLHYPTYAENRRSDSRI